MHMDRSELEESILTTIKPSAAEREHLKDVASKLMDTINTIASRNNIPLLSTQLVGSAARETWISGTHDLDIFMKFDEQTARHDLETYGLSLGREVAKQADRWEERYAEHPYIKMHYHGFDVDLVPCYRVSSASKIISAVDRTPFHNEFIKENICEMEDHVLLLKQFMRGNGVYGSELKTRGFSGYLAELLIIQYGSFYKVLTAASDWKPGLVIDLMEHANTKFDDPLVVIDPTDPKRNVAAALSLDSFCTFIDGCRRYLKNPARTMFFPDPVPPLTNSDIQELLHMRESSMIAIVFNTPDVVEDIFYPQFYKMEHSVVSMLEINEFRVLKSGTLGDADRAVLLIELESATLPNIRKHHGPPVWVHKHAENFLSMYENNDDVYTMYIEDGRYVVELPRNLKDAASLLGAKLTECSLGKHISRSINEEVKILQDEDICMIDDKALRSYLRTWL